MIDRLYQRALRLQPALADVRVDYGPFLQAQGRTEEALAAYEAALAEQPWNALAALKTRNGVLLRTLEKPDASPALAWDLRTEAGSFIPSGLYLIHIRAFNNTGRPQETTVLRWAAVRHHTP